MSQFNFEIAAGESITLKTAGKYCDRNIVVTGSGGSAGANILELLYTEGVEITPEDWGDFNVPQRTIFPYSLCQKIALPDTQIVPIDLQYGALTEFDTGLGMITNLNNTENMFYTCSSLTKLKLGPNCASFGRRAFMNATDLLTEVRYYGDINTWASAPRNNWASTPLYNNSKCKFYLGDSETPVSEVELTTATEVTQFAFHSFKQLNSLILEGDTVKTLSNTNAFSYTPIASGTGTIWIKPVSGDEAALVAEYKAATNWVAYEGVIKPYSEYIGG